MHPYLAPSGHHWPEDRISSIFIYRARKLDIVPLLQGPHAGESYEGQPANMSFTLSVAGVDLSPTKLHLGA